jgi:hypothetical protein
VVDPGFAWTNAIQHCHPVVIFAECIFIRSAGKIFRKELATAGGAYVAVAVQVNPGLSSQSAKTQGSLRGDKVFAVRIVTDTPLREFLGTE